MIVTGKGPNDHRVKRNGYRVMIVDRHGGVAVFEANNAPFAKMAEKAAREMQTNGESAREIADAAKGAVQMELRNGGATR